MEQDPWEGAEGRVEAVAVGDWAGWVAPFRPDRADSVCVRNAAIGNLIK